MSLLILSSSWLLYRSVNQSQYKYWDVIYIYNKNHNPNSYLSGFISTKFSSLNLIQPQVQLSGQHPGSKKFFYQHFNVWVFELRLNFVLLGQNDTTKILILMQWFVCVCDWCWGFFYFCFIHEVNFYFVEMLIKNENPWMERLTKNY